MPSHPSVIDPARVERAARHLTAAQRAVLTLCAAEPGQLDTVAARLGIGVLEAERLLADALCKLDRALEREETPWWRFWVHVRRPRW